MQYTTIDDIKGQFRKRFSSFWIILFLPALPFLPLSKASASSMNSLLRGWLCNVSGSQMQAIATTNAKADIEMEGKKYGNLSQKESFGNRFGYFTVG